MTWTTDELARLTGAEELRVAGTQPDGSPATPVIVWAVVVDDDLYLRSVRGASGGWYRAVQRRHEGRIDSGGVAVETRFTDVPAGDAVNDRIDAAYAEKYPAYRSAVASIITPEARTTTMRVERA